MKTDASTFQALEKVFHEKSRLAIVACVAGADDEGASFTELRETCELTDGNLKAHLVALEAAGVVTTRRIFGNGRPRTLVALTSTGREEFVIYLGALEDALRAAAQSAGVASRGAAAARRIVPTAPMAAGA
ncbi:MAG: transcriptional regulator [Puniceicoccales bacterium]|nr:transcriptional regulator [Puniceicoccales bacterium]